MHINGTKEDSINYFWLMFNSMLFLKDFTLHIVGMKTLSHTCAMNVGI